MARKWFMFMDRDGKSAASADVVFVDMEDVAALRCAVKDQYNDSCLAGITSYELTAYANQAAYDSKKPLQANSAIGPLGASMEDALIVQDSSRTIEDSGYFILPQDQEAVEKAAFLIVGDESSDHAGRGGIGFAVCFTSTLAVTCDHNLTEHRTVGSVISLVWKEEMVETTIVARIPQLDFAILKSSTPRSFIEPWNRNPKKLEGHSRLALVFPFGSDKLMFFQASGMSLSLDRRHVIFSCPAYAGGYGAALVIQDGLLVGINLAMVNVVVEELKRKSIIKGRMNDVEESLYNTLKRKLARGYVCLLASAFKNAAE